MPKNIPTSAAPARGGYDEHPTYEAVDEIKCGDVNHDTACAGLNELLREIILQRHCQLVVHVELDADKQAPPDLQDRYLLHGGSNLKSA